MHAKSPTFPRSGSVQQLRARFERPAAEASPRPAPTRPAASTGAVREAHLGAAEGAREAHQALVEQADAGPVQDLRAGGTELTVASPLLLQHADRGALPSAGRGRSSSPREEAGAGSGSPGPSSSSSSSAARPEGPTVSFTQGDFLYGPDTGIQKPRTLLRMDIQRKTAAAGHRVWEGHRDASLKIDSLTQGMGPTPPVPTRHQLGGRPLRTSGAPSTRGALPPTWQTNVGTAHALREEDKPAFVEWISHHPRFSPAASASHSDWNRRFKRTSKAGLQFALQERGYNVHFVLPRGTDFDQIVRESGSHPRHAPAKYEAFYQDGQGGEVGPIEEKRITHAELRWLFRHKDDPTVQSNVQFWDYDPSDGSFQPVAAPWERDPAPWAEYAEARAKKPSRNGDTYSVARDPRRPNPASARFVVGRDGAYTHLD